VKKPLRKGACGRSKEISGSLAEGGGRGGEGKKGRVPRDTTLNQHRGEKREKKMEKAAGTGSCDPLCSRKHTRGGGGGRS